MPIGNGRSLLWVRLRARSAVRGVAGRTLLVGTTHLMHADTPSEMANGQNARHPQVTTLLNALRGTALPGEATLVMGDMNEPFQPRWRMRADGLVDCFTALGITPTATFPAHPLAEWDAMYPAVPLDFVVSRGAVM